jgi:hypothetical protein
LPKLFPYKLTDSQLLDIKNILSAYLADRLNKEMDKVWNEQNWSNDLMDSWANEHWRIDSNKVQ